MTDQITVSTLLRLNWYNLPVILLETKKSWAELDWSNNVLNYMRLNEYNPPVILLEKKKSWAEHDWSDNGLKYITHL